MPSTGPRMGLPHPPSGHTLGVDVVYSTQALGVDLARWTIWWEQTFQQCPTLPNSDHQYFWRNIIVKLRDECEMVHMEASTDNWYHGFSFCWYCNHCTYLDGSKSRLNRRQFSCIVPNRFRGNMSLNTNFCWETTVKTMLSSCLYYEYPKAIQFTSVGNCAWLDGTVCSSSDGLDQYNCHGYFQGTWGIIFANVVKSCQKRLS